MLRKFAIATALALIGVTSPQFAQSALTFRFESDIDSFKSHITVDENQLTPTNLIGLENPKICSDCFIGFFFEIKGNAGIARLFLEDVDSSFVLLNEMDIEFIEFQARSSNTNKNIINNKNSLDPVTNIALTALDEDSLLFDYHTENHQLFELHFHGEWVLVSAPASLLLLLVSLGGIGIFLCRAGSLAPPGTSFLDVPLLCCIIVDTRCNANYQI